MAAVHGVLDEFLNAAVGDARGFLELGARAVHAAGGLQAVAAHKGHLLQHQHLRALLGGPHGGGQARAARAHGDQVALQRGLLLLRGSLFRRGDFKGRDIDAGLLQRLANGGLDGVAGDRGGRNAVHRDAVGLHHCAGQLLHGDGADAHGFILFQDLDVVESGRIGGHFDDDVAADSLADALRRDLVALREGDPKGEHSECEYQCEQSFHILLPPIIYCNAPGRSTV